MAIEGYTVASEFEKHFASFAFYPSIVRGPAHAVTRILMLCCENESVADVSLGDLVARLPLLESLQHTFFNASITLVLKSQHACLGLLPRDERLVIKVPQGNKEFRRRSFFRKSWQDIVSKSDFDGGPWDIVIDSTSRDGFVVVKDILHALPRDYIGAFVPASMLTSVWMANSVAGEYKRGDAPKVDRRADQLFMLRFEHHSRQALKAKTMPTIAPAVLLQKHGQKACLLIDKSPVVQKQWIRNGVNQFDALARRLQQDGFDVYVHRFVGPYEQRETFPVYTLSSPEFVTAGLFDLFRSIEENAVSSVVGIDTGIMHALRAKFLPSGLRMYSIFTSPHSDPIVWTPPNSECFATFSGCNSPLCKFDITWEDLFSAIKAN